MISITPTNEISSLQDTSAWLLLGTLWELHFGITAQRSENCCQDCTGTTPGLPGACHRAVPGVDLHPWLGLLSPSLSCQGNC